MISYPAITNFSGVQNLGMIAHLRGETSADRLEFPTG